MPSTSTKVGHGLAKALGIKLNYRDPLGYESDPVTRGESTLSAGTIDTYSYTEEEPSSAEWIVEQLPSLQDLGHYFYSLFPFLQWIGRYNLQWFVGDLVAGITVGAVVVPQGMAYAELAELPVEYGLYSSFMGVLIYWFFATSKDITIGPVAVLSMLVGNIILSVQAKHPEFTGPEIAQALSIVAGGIVTFLGLTRLGFIVDFIPLPAICAYMTGSAINIAAGQVKTLLGQTAGFSTRAATYMVIINTLKYLPTCQLDAAMGLTALAMLYIIRSACNYGARKQPHRAKVYFFISTLRTVFVILFYTMISAAVNLHRKDNPAFKILGSVPRGFTHAGVPVMSSDLVKSLVSQLPATIIVMLIEHISISKSFGRVNNYTINPSQEFVAIGISNLLGPFLGAYPATGSFSRTAIKSKAGVRSPLAGLITAIVVLLAIYALTAVFFYIPSAPLSGVIIHAVGDLITSPNTVYQFWRVSPLDVIIFFIGVIVIVFSTIEDGIYCVISVSAAVMLFRIAKARGRFLGQVRIHSVVGDHVLNPDGKYGSLGSTNTGAGAGAGAATAATTTSSTTTPEESEHKSRTIFLPLNRMDGSNPEIELEQPHPGIFIYRFSEGFNYPNANHYTDYLVDTIFKQTRRTNPNSFGRPGDRPWNNPGPRRGKVEEDRSHLPILRAVILDFASVNNVDTTAIQNLIDIRNQLDLYASPERVQWHFAHINNRWTKRALAAAGFGYPTPTSDDGFHRWKPIYSVAEIGGSASAAAHAEIVNHERELKLKQNVDPEAGLKMPEPETHGVEHAMSNSSGGSSNDVPADKLDGALTHSRPYRGGRKVTVHGVNRPFFHIDLTSALQSAVANAAELAVDPETQK
ncbi:hypothetical protein ASPZODRAFT_151268 [Penicilliopsis zonata CBS 506.65]|uniref:STAS domain-containing protein n=1 Tax=Penicilliopsis zonata CBS 506.65 TaxID=1073090 RepID=A0A1L9SKU1_9EURO|nr:hypothetical protein ASPZODRAFT_151268 [Penicilliopsis zonata CBS 506.65]OJJ47828.1 hypothetical protein ASPZODRAFT_151268 [Penicilliopsis zonata CBS 506.65]